MDVAIGIGEPAVTAARNVGPSGKVTSIDISPAILVIARERASGLSNVIEFQEADAESLRLPPSSFDAIIYRFGLMFMPDLVGALKTMRGSLVLDGRIDAAVWSSMDIDPSFLILFEIVSKETGTPPPPPGSSRPFSLADTSLLRKKFEQAGFNDVKIESSKMDFKMPSPEEYVDFMCSTTAPSWTMMAGLSAARQEEIWNKVVDAARKHAADSNTRAVRFTNEVIYVSARR